MKSSYYLIIGIVLLAVIGAVAVFQGQPEQVLPAKDQEQMQEGQMQEEEQQGGLVAEAVVLYTDSGFAPNLFVVKKGDTVTFVNNSSNLMWPASAMHPTHTVYPGSDIEKCGTAEEQGIFDACEGIGQGMEWSFMFDQAGSWNYHDHLNPTRFGTIIVEE